jgi:hypothetical protein
MNTNDQDLKAKAAAKASRAGMVGAVAVGAGHVSKLDRRINDKMANGGGNGATKPGAVASSDWDEKIVAKVHREPPTQLSSLEDSVQSKVRGGPPATMPGAVAASSSNMEDAIASKVRSAGAGARYGMNSLEESMQAKVLGAGSSAHLEANAFEDSVRAKVRRETTGTLLDTSNETKNREDAFQAKVYSNDPGNQLRTSAVSGVHTTHRVNIVSDDQGQRFSNKMGFAPIAMPHDDDQMDEKEMFFLDQSTGTNKFGAPTIEQLGGVITTADRGIVQVPDVEHGNAGGVGVGRDGLAVAVAVEEEDEDVFIPAAVEYDPDAKPPMYRNRRFRLYALLAFFVVVVVAIGAAVGVTMGKKNEYHNTPSPTSAPTSLRESFGIRQQVERVIGTDLLNDPKSPYSKALEWITFEDPLALTPNDQNFVQRYVAVYFYYATTVEGPWLSCNPPANPHTDPSTCQFKKLGGIFPLTYFDVPWNRWLSSANECDWAGITCDGNGQIRSMALGTYE